MPDQRQEVGEHEAVRISLANLLTFPFVAEAVAAGAEIFTIGGGPQR